MCAVVVNVLSNPAIILVMKEELIALFYILYYSIAPVLPSSWFCGLGCGM